MSLSSVLIKIQYEFIPLRPKDAHLLFVYLYKNVMQLVIALISLSRWFPLFVLQTVKSINKAQWLICALFIVGLYVFNYAGFGSLFVILSLFAALFSNLGDNSNDNTLSAYSIFNKNHQSLMGTLTGDQFDREIRHNNVIVEGDGEYEDAEGPPRAHLDNNNNNNNNNFNNNNNNNNVPFEAPRRRRKKAQRGYEGRRARKEEGMMLMMQQQQQQHRFLNQAEGDEDEEEFEERVFDDDEEE